MRCEQKQYRFEELHIPETGPPFHHRLSMTLGGLRVDEATGLVERPDGSTIAGLCAVGRAAVGLCSNGYFSGMSLADRVYSDCRAGANLATTVGETAMDTS